MKRFEKRYRKLDWKYLVQSSYERGYQEGDYLIMAGYQAALARQQSPTASPEQEQTGPDTVPQPPAAIPYVNG